MFDIGWDELLVIGIVALLVIGPKDLPQALRIAGQWLAKARTLSREFQVHVEDLMRESQLDELKRDFTDMTHAPELDGLESELMTGQSSKPKVETKPADVKLAADETAPTLASPPAP